MKLEDFLRRGAEVLALGDATIRTEGRTDWGGSHVAPGEFAAFRAAALSFLQNLFGEHHPYYRDFDARIDTSISANARAGRAIVEAAVDELRGGWFVSTRGLLSAEIFGDFLEMADHLLTEGYKDPAAVLIGSVLEKHLRYLASKNGIPTEVAKGAGQIPKKADLINAELTKANVYNGLDQKNITAWLDLRNKAAHGHYNEYDAALVVLMHQGVSNFMAKTI
ncbi:MAG: hypothetical protein SFU84_07275 [Gemmatimonadales bacterium]|nr:hypothetical protein [Gemmatimonadales bacterium]